jgi:hypothetical protein
MAATSGAKTRFALLPGLTKTSYFMRMSGGTGGFLASSIGGR